MRLFPHKEIHRIGASLFEAVGASADDAAIASGELVTSSLMGHDSHGVLRIPDYLDLVEKGDIVPSAIPDIERTSATTAVVDCGHNFGAVGARYAVDIGIEIAKEQKTACVTTRRCNHVGRLGAFVERAAASGLIALATCNSPIYGHFVLPWGGKEGRLATNPIAYAAPTGGDPIVADLSTSVAPEGKIRSYKNQGKPLPEGWILDAEGRPSTDADDFYGPPRGGILPLGAGTGHKGYALSLLVEILGTALAGISSVDKTVVGNGVCFILIDPTAFCPLERFRLLMDEMIQYVKSSPPAPGFDEVLVPGEIEFRTLRARTDEGVPVDEPTWQAIGEHARRLGVDLAETG